MKQNFNFTEAYSNYNSCKFFYAALFLLFFCPLTVASQSMAPCQPFPPPISQSVVDRLECIPDSVQKFNDPYIYNSANPEDESTCAIGITRLLARPAESQWLKNFGYPQGCLGNPDLAEVNCTPPYNFCETSYCPDKYAELIEYYVDADISFLGKVYTAAFREHQFFPGEPWFCYGLILANDINYAYDCKGKMRPVMQAFIGEIIEPNNFLAAIAVNGADGVDRHIPARVIDIYFEYFRPDADLPHPTNPNQTLADYYSIPRYFQPNRMMTGGHLDISLVEARMWFLYQAITCFDFGYRAIHMGIYTLYANSAPDGNDPGYGNLYNLTTAIRRYAEEQGSFFLLSGEVPYENIDNGLSAKWGNTDQLIFDFDSRAMRPREVAPVSGDGDINGDQVDLGEDGVVGCDQPISAADLQAINSSPCATDPFLSVIDPCTINSAGGTSGGISPLGCSYEQVPYLVHWDGYAGIEAAPGFQQICEEDPCDPDCVWSTGGVASNGPSSLTWGFDDNRWFGQPNALSDECRAWWFDYFYCNRRDYHNGNGFMMLPTTLLINYIENNVCDTSDVEEFASDGYYLITDDSIFSANIIANTFAPKVPTIKIVKSCIYTYCALECGGNIIQNTSNRFRVAYTRYMITVDNKDCSSIYSIHIKGPAGNWLPQTFGDTAYVIPQIHGFYQIVLRQDNLGLSPPTTYGTRQDTFNHVFSIECCKLVPFETCFPLQLSSNCIDSDSEKATYDFQIASSDLGGYITNVRSINSSVVIENVQYNSPTSASGRLLVYNNTPSPKIDLILNYYDDWPTGYPDTINVTQYPVNCLNETGDRDFESTADLYDLSEFSVSPNPTNSFINIRHFAMADQHSKINIYNVVGQIVSTENFLLKKGVNTFEQNVVDWPEGMYFVTISTSKYRLEGRFLKSSN